MNHIHININTLLRCHPFIEQTSGFSTVYLKKDQ